MTLRALVVAAVALAFATALIGCGGGGGDTPEVGTCGATEPSELAGCQNVDYGSCGGACCNLVITSDKSPLELGIALTDVLTMFNNGGPDGQFTRQKMAENNLSSDAAARGFANLTNYSAGMPEPFTGKEVWIGQVHHTTTGENHYVDTINLNVRSSGSGSVLHAFSSSLIAGALGDNGQNYKNLVMLLKGVVSDDAINKAVHLNNSCPSAAIGRSRANAQREVSAHGAALRSSRLLSAKPLPLAAKPAKHAPAIEGTCGKAPSPVEDCQNVDFGSCGNACCGLLVSVPESPTLAAQKLNSTLGGGGPDGHYTLQTTAGNQIGFDNLTKYVPDLPEPFNASTSGVYLGQVHHMTDGPLHYNDTINFNVIANPAGVGSLIHAFSLSLVGGALGDAGQNYKNIMMPLKAAFPQQSIKHHYFESCPDPSVIV